MLEEFILACYVISLLFLSLAIFNLTMPIGGHARPWRKFIWRWESRILNRVLRTHGGEEWGDD